MPLARPSGGPIARRLVAISALALIGSLLSLLAAPSAHASLILALDTPTMVQRADHIVVADVLSVTAAWDANHERIFTTVDLAVVDTWKGPVTAGQHIKVVQPGGTVGDMSMVVIGMSRFAAGERALVFLQGPVAGARVVGLAQGKRLMRRDTTTGKWFVGVPDRAGASFVRNTPAASAAPVFERAARPVEDLRAEVRDLVAKASRR